ncbi:hypothetical protein F4604DRAFT_1691317 [Suillus subluteus]|nr:hypothetical protein F4604DRAFT_1691317 [Suillus subluteus]
MPFLKAPADLTQPIPGITPSLDLYPGMVHSNNLIHSNYGSHKTSSPGYSSVGSILDISKLHKDIRQEIAIFPTPALANNPPPSSNSVLEEGLVWFSRLHKQYLFDTNDFFVHVHQKGQLAVALALHQCIIKVHKKNRRTLTKLFHNLLVLLVQYKIKSVNKIASPTNVSLCLGSMVNKSGKDRENRVDEEGVGHGDEEGDIQDKGKGEGRENNENMDFSAEAPELVSI